MTKNTYSKYATGGGVLSKESAPKINRYVGEAR